MNWSPAHIAVPIDLVGQIPYCAFFHKKTLSPLLCPWMSKKILYMNTATGPFVTEVFWPPFHQADFYEYF
jgi:hypothetical protein